MFKEYFISSLKIEYTPLNYSAGANFLANGPIRCGTSMTTNTAYPIPDGAFAGALDYKEYDSSRRFKRFYKVGKYARGMDVPYRPFTGPVPTQPNCQTVLKTEVRGAWAPGDELGEVKVTWYMRARHRQKI